MASQARLRKGKGPKSPPEIDVDLPESAAVARIAAGLPTPRSTLGSPLISHATYKRSGVGDLAAGPRRHISLSEVELVSWMCCMAPVFMLFSTYLSVFFSSLFCTYLAELICAYLTLLASLWIGNMSLACLLGIYRLREAGSIDWHARLHEIPEEEKSGIKHIILLPNYMESEKMLKETLDNLARSKLAKNCLHVVLGMEGREGQPARAKAERIIADKKHLFADIFATYHPQGLPGEVAGKSSNTQWAFREALRRYGASLSKRDLSKVWITVADADTLLHPHYLSAMTYQGLKMDKEERSWTIWQPPVMLLRNLFNVPAVTRATAHGTLIFELSALSWQRIFPAFAYSSYSMTLALASHPEVDGWDVDVIAEDHHMFCKCFFAALWELSHAKKEHAKVTNGDEGNAVEIVPQVKVQPVFLPAVSYLAESSDGYVASLKARFQQGRRHMQGLVELGYVCLQWARLSSSIGARNIPLRTHFSIALILVKMHTLQITCTCQCFALVMMALTKLVPRAGSLLAYLLQVGFDQMRQDVGSMLASMNGAEKALAAGISQISGVMVLYTIAGAVVISDMVEGRYYQNVPRAHPNGFVWQC
ncbi:unnamed protein product [Symbiodinium pilosum]|uniref:Glycosyltransferase 2-like domain-containing protein n=1 Tax=Symbiodinium pilosum TaxID=2952 RepID=A0A812UIK2_SYMPI|nr:unnamed protein product [Symbiodinium pilosum]